MRCQIINEDVVCPKCQDMLNMNIDIGDSFFYDICSSCGFKRKKKKNGEVVEDMCLADIIRHAENKRAEEGRKLD